MGKEAFEKFMHKQPSGAKKKEQVRQEKKKIKAASRALADELRKKNEEKFRQVTKDNRPPLPVTKKTNIPKKAVSIPDHPVKPKSRPRYQKGTPVKRSYEQITQKPEKESSSPAGEKMPLNKFIAHAGVCARREAAQLVKEGVVTVNGDIVFEPGYKVSEKDRVSVKGTPAYLQKKLVYILLNKPKDYLTTAKDPEGRKTVFDLVKGATGERIYPVGRLDRNTTGVLLMTNDGELAQKLTHPSFEVKKIYEVKLDKPVSKKDCESLLGGITLEDGFVQADAVGFVDANDKSILGIQIHSGRNRIVRRIFEHLGYDVKNLDRVMFGNLTKKNVDRGKWRFLNEKEVRLLKFMNQSFLKPRKENA